MAKGAKVSIVVPMYNVERYLHKCLDSITSQSYTNLEIVLINDGSLDNSGVIADQFAEKDNRIKVLHKKNEGVSLARNMGIDEATGDFICFADADDILEPDYVDYLLRLALENDADISYTSEMFTTFRKKKIPKDYISVYTPEEATVAILCYKVPIGVYCKMFKREFLDDNNIRFIPGVSIGEGFNFNTNSFQRANKVVAGRRKVYFYRRDNENSAMTKFNIDKCKMALYAIDIIKQDLLIKSKLVLKAWEFSYWHTHSDMYYFIENSDSGKKYPELYEKCKNIAREKAFIAFSVPTKKMERIRAIFLKISPKFVAKLILWRNRIFS